MPILELGVFIANDCGISRYDRKGISTTPQCSCRSQNNLGGEHYSFSVSIVFVGTLFLDLCPVPFRVLNPLWHSCLPPTHVYGGIVFATLSSTPKRWGRGIEWEEGESSIET